MSIFLKAKKCAVDVAGNEIRRTKKIKQKCHGMAKIEKALSVE